MGSGSVGVAALQAERWFWGNDICQEAVAITQERVQHVSV
jgi:DNA modification methylase